MSSARERLRTIDVRVEHPRRQGRWQQPGRRSAAVAWIEAFFVRHRDRLVWVHAAMFVGFLGLIFVPAFLPEPPPGSGPLEHLTPFANFALWGLWFPLVFLSVIFTGRSWCGLLCPMGAASEWANRVGLKRPIPGWVRWPGTPIVSFLIITILRHYSGHRIIPSGRSRGGDARVGGLI